MLNVYLKKEWKRVEQIMANEFPDDIVLEDLVEDLWEDLRVAREQIALTYGIACERDKERKEK